METAGVVEQMKDQGVTYAHHIIKDISAKRTKGATVVLTFAGLFFPRHEMKECRPYIPLPFVALNVMFSGIMGKLASVRTFSTPDARENVKRQKSEHD